MTEVAFPFPIGGVNRNWSFQNQPVPTTPDCLNVRPYSADVERARGGSRPGLAQAYTQQIGGASNPIQWIGWLDWGFGDTVFYEDDFDYADGQLSTRDDSLWTSAHADLEVESGAVVTATPYPDSITLRDSGTIGGIGADTWNDYDLSVTLQWNYGTDGELELYFGAVKILEFTISYSEVGFPGLGFTSVMTITQGTTTYSRSYSALVGRVAADLRVIGNKDTVTVLLDGRQVIQTARSDATYSAASFKFGTTNPTEGSASGDRWLPDSVLRFALTRYSLIAITRATSTARKLVAIGSRDLWHESSVGTTMAEVGSGATDVVASVARVQAAHCNGHLYIADGSEAQDYDPINDSVAAFAPRIGDLIQSVKLVANWRNRLVWSGAVQDPQNIFMSRADDAYDYDYGQDDAQSAVALNLGVNGRIGDPVQALCPASDNTLIVGCTRSIHAILGDPAMGGQSVLVTNETGILGPNAWCHGPDGIYFLGENGFYRLSGRSVENISDTKVPEIGGYADVTGSGSSGQYYLSCAYDIANDGIHVFLTPFTAGTATHYFYDLRTGGFFPEQFPNDMGPTCAAYYNATSASHRNLMLGGRNGYIYEFGSGKNDDTDQQTETAISSYVILQPRRLSRNVTDDSILTDLVGVLGDDSDSVTYQILNADTAEAVQDVTPWATGTWTSGRNNVSPYRVRGGAHGVKVLNATADRAWSLESVTGAYLEGGRQR